MMAVRVNGCAYFLFDKEKRAKKAPANENSMLHAAKYGKQFQLIIFEKKIEKDILKYIINFMNQEE